jgi:hypothetical protein
MHAEGAPSQDQFRRVRTSAAGMIIIRCHRTIGFLFMLVLVFRNVCARGRVHVQEDGGIHVYVYIHTHILKIICFYEIKPFEKRRLRAVANHGGSLDCTHSWML